MNLLQLRKVLGCKDGECLRVIVWLNIVYLKCKVSYYDLERL